MDPNDKTNTTGSTTATTETDDAVGAGSTVSEPTPTQSVGSSMPASGMSPAADAADTVAESSTTPSMGGGVSGVGNNPATTPNTPGMSGLGSSPTEPTVSGAGMGSTAPTMDTGLGAPANQSVEPAEETTTTQPTALSESTMPADAGTGATGMGGLTAEPEEESPAPAATNPFTGVASGTADDDTTAK